MEKTIVLLTVDHEPKIIAHIAEDEQKRPLLFISKVNKEGMLCFTKIPMLQLQKLLNDYFNECAQG